jgi:class 3 adenylate cyclase
VEAQSTLDSVIAKPPPEGVEHCPTCGAEMPAGFRFCGQCGRALGAVLAPNPSDVVTIVFLDLEGFSTFSSRAPSHDTRELIRIFHWLVREQVARHRGFEVKQLGDGFMVAFSDPKRAVAFAVDIQRSMTGHPIASGLRLRAGINSGKAIREGDDFFGNTVNIASRIVMRAQGGQVLLSDATRSLATDLEGVQYIDAGRRQLRGIPGRVRLYQAVWV